MQKRDGGWTGEIRLNMELPKWRLKKKKKVQGVKKDLQKVDMMEEEVEEDVR